MPDPIDQFDGDEKTALDPDMTLPGARQSGEPNHLPELTPTERAAMEALPRDFIDRILRGERPLPRRLSDKDKQLLRAILTDPDNLDCLKLRQVYETTELTVGRKYLVRLSDVWWILHGYAGADGVRLLTPGSGQFSYEPQIDWKAHRVYELPE